MPARGVLAALAVAATVVAACGGDDGGDGGAGSTEAPEHASTGDDGAPVSRACGMLTVDEVSGLFGEDASVVPGGGGNDAVASNCLWQAEVGEAGAPTLYQLELSVYFGGAPLDPSLLGGEPEPLDGPGEGAFVIRSDTTGGTTAGFRQGDTSVLLRYAILLGADAPDPAAQSDDVVALLDDVAGRLG
ncbi:MAG TPA: hypothetical protein VFM27_13650 [Acidimicrobiales bacterium]|nr:hypothetical protein [Acidimicrobiales bacterium]